MRIRNALFHNTIWRLLGLPLNFLTTVLIVRILGTENSGRFFYYLTAVTLIATFLRFGLENGIVFFGSASVALRRQIRSLLILIAVLQIAASYFLIRYFAPQSDIPVYLSMIFVMADISFYYQTAFNQSRKMFRIMGIAALYLLILQAAVLAAIHFDVFDMSGAQNVMLILTIAAAAKLVFGVAWSLRAAAKIDDEPVTARLSARSFFKWSMLNYAITVLFFLITRTDLWFVEKHCNAVELSNYLQASRITQMMLLIPSMAGGVIFRYSVDNEETFETSFKKIVGGISMLFAAAYLILALGGSYLFPLFFGADFQQMYSLTMILFPGVFFLSITLLIGAYFEGKNRQVVSGAALLIMLFLLAGVDALLVSRFGIFAAAWVFSGATLAGAVFMATGYYRSSGVPPHKLLFTKLSEIEFLRSLGFGRDNS